MNANFNHSGKVIQTFETINLIGSVLVYGINSMQELHYIYPLKTL